MGTDKNLFIKEYLKDKDKIDKDKKIDKNLKRMADELYSEAKFLSDPKKSYEKAMEAYEIYPLDYQFKSFAISKLIDNEEKEIEYKKLIDEIEKSIVDSMEGLFIFYEENEIYSERFKNLKFKYIITLIKNKKDQEALQELILFNTRYSYLDFKTKHLVLNLCLILWKKELFVSEYNSIIGKENILYKLPFSFLLFKNNQEEKSKDEIIRINQLNHYICDLIISLDNEDIKKEVRDCSPRFRISSREEALYSLKYFIDLYNDVEFKNFVKEIRGNV